MEYIGFDVESYKKTIGARIRRRRRELGYNSQEAFAKALGLDQPRVNKWETGKNYPDASHRQKIAEKLKVTESEFFSVNEPPETPPKAELGPETIQAIREVVKESLAETQPRDDDAEKLLGLISRLTPAQRRTLIATVEQMVRINGSDQSKASS